jgi:hypothetical protein
MFYRLQKHQEHDLISLRFDVPRLDRGIHPYASLDPAVKPRGVVWGNDVPRFNRGIHYNVFLDPIIKPRSIKREYGGFRHVH